MFRRLFVFRRILERLRKTPDPIDYGTWNSLMESHRLFSDLDTDERARLKTIAELILSKKDISASGGPSLTEPERAELAAQIALPVLDLGIRWYKGWWTIVVFPKAYRRTWTEEDEFGVVHEYDDDVEGEVLQYGSVILSRRNVFNAGGNGNVVIHEMAHQIDRQSGDIDGMPPLHGELDARAWRETFDENLEALRRKASRGRKTPLDEYACESREEFFAVASERFFAAPVSLERRLPEIYRLLSQFYLQDPAERRRARKVSSKTNAPHSTSQNA